MPTKKKQKPDHQLGVSGRANEGMIRNLMKLKKRKGNPKDYVILVGETLFDAYGNYPVKFKPKIKLDGMLLLHKKHLHRFIDDKIAARFWNRKLRIRIPRHPKGAANATSRSRKSQVPPRP